MSTTPMEICANDYTPASPKETAATAQTRRDKMQKTEMTVGWKRSYSALYRQELEPTIWESNDCGEYFSSL